MTEHTKKKWHFLLTSSIFLYLLRSTRSWKNAGTSTPSHVLRSRSLLWVSTCSGTARNCRRKKKESPKVPSSSLAEVDGRRWRLDSTTPLKVDVSDSDSSELPRCLWARPPETERISSTPWMGRQMCLYEELAGLALAVPVKLHLKEKKIFFLFCLLCMCIYWKYICVNMSRKFYNFINSKYSKFYIWNCHKIPM